MNRFNPLKLKKSSLTTWGGIGLFVLIYGFLISQSLVSPFSHYQAYKKDIVTLQALEASFNQEVLTSRYKLFSSYDGLVNNLAEQEALQQKLTTVPGFIRTKDQQAMARILQERQIALTQKEELSEWFKSRNALLKNSLRYLPLLTRQVESSFKPPAQPTKDSDDETKTEITSETSESSETFEKSLSTAVSTELSSLSPAQQATIRDNLSQLIRNLLLYNASGEEQVADRAETLTQSLADLENTLEIPEDELPTKVFRSHANVILTTKPLVEDLTEQLLTPLGQHTNDLETTFERAYKQANRRASIFRGITLLWFLGLLGAVNYWCVKRYIKHSKYTDPAFTRYRHQVATLATMAQQLDSISEQPLQQHSTDHNTDPHLETTALTSLTPLLKQEDDLGILARHLQGIGNLLSHNPTMDQVETFVFLTARLSLLTKHRRKLITAEAATAIRSALETILTEQACQLIDVQFSADQVSVQFSYPLSLSLGQLAQQIKQTSAAAIQPTVTAIFSELQSPNEDIWSETTLIASCDASPGQTTKETLLASQGEAS
ncbi:MAG: DAHL domain-containing protein [Cyanobacteria bacterium P01_F01_bin.53]